MAEKVSKPLTLEEFNKEVMAKYGKNVISNSKGEFANSTASRFSSGIYSLDVALGGGWPIGKIGLIAGQFSEGKTEICLQAIGSMANYDKRTKLHKLVMPQGTPFEPCRSVYIDLEYTFDTPWAISKGFNPAKDSIIRPSSGESTVDIVSEIIGNNLYDLVVVDSLAAATPTKEVESSAEDVLVGNHARLLNRAFRMWTNQAVRVSSRGQVPPTVLCINQIRYNIGVMFGDPRTMPGGQMQRFAASVILYTKSAKYGEKGGESQVELSGVIFKNKTYRPKELFSYKLAVGDVSPELPKGTIDNISDIVKDASDSKFIIRKGSNYELFGVSYPSVAAIRDAIHANEVLKVKLWRSLIKHRTGNLI